MATLARNIQLLAVRCASKFNFEKSLILKNHIQNQFYSFRTHREITEVYFYTVHNYFHKQAIDFVPK